MCCGACHVPIDEGNIVENELLLNIAKKPVKRLLKCDINAYHSMSLPDTHCPGHDIDCNHYTLNLHLNGKCYRNYNS